ncbi:EboA domain-containing protein [Serinibacter arcticus]|uniref:EboA domain-containing protein n=1 Tax=Serinibacter arcticus TaxID=1655435 RepID=UPI0018EEC76E|nr:EboA domain-containing protein [Serinibacter arcticus]
MTTTTTLNTERLTEQRARVRTDPGVLPVLFAAAARTLGRGPGPTTGEEDPDGLLHARLEDLGRRELLLAWRPVAGSPEQAVEVLADLYHHGDSDERRAVLRALPDLDLGAAALDLVRDALRTNDTRLVAAAVGPYGGAHLPEPEWRHAVLKCLFVGVPLAAVDGLDERTDPELVRMAAGLAAEREAAGRVVSEDTRRLLSAPTTSGSIPSEKE